MKHRLARHLIVALFLLAPLFVPAGSFASSIDSTEKEMFDARIETYAKKMELDSGGTALTWFLLIMLGALGVGAMFKNANRSHLD